MVCLLGNGAKLLQSAMQAHSSLSKFDQEMMVSRVVRNKSVNVLEQRAQEISKEIKSIEESYNPNRERLARLYEIQANIQSTLAKAR